MSMLLQLRRDFVLKGRGPKRRHFFLGKKIDLLSRLSSNVCAYCVYFRRRDSLKGSDRLTVPSTDNQAPSSPFSSFGRSMFGIRKGQAHSLGANHESSFRDSELESFQKHVTDRFQDLSGDLLSIDQSISEFLERSVKAFDICNASRNGIEKIHTWLKHVEIVLCSLGSNQRAFKEGQFLRARKALMDLALAMVDGKESGSAFSHRNRSFGRNGTSKDHHCQSKGHSWSHSWSVSPSWSAAKQLQSIASNLVPPGANEIIATRGMAVPMYAMNSVLLFVLIDGLQPLEHQVKKAFRKIMTCRIEMLDLLGT
ncbi:hypothetical protein AHAS_Ahas20G0080900 [Arachis hypogaea]